MKSGGISVWSMHCDGSAEYSHDTIPLELSWLRNEMSYFVQKSSTLINQLLDD